MILVSMSGRRKVLDSNIWGKFPEGSLWCLVCKFSANNRFKSTYPQKIKIQHPHQPLPYLWVLVYSIQIPKCKLIGAVSQHVLFCLVEEESVVAWTVVKYSSSYFAVPQL